MEEEQSQLASRVLSGLATALGVAQNVAPFIPVPMLAPTVTLLTTIVSAVQVCAMNYIIKSI